MGCKHHPKEERERELVALHQIGDEVGSSPSWNMLEIRGTCLWGVCVDCRSHVELHFLVARLEEEEEQEEGGGRREREGWTFD